MPDVERYNDTPPDTAAQLEQLVQRVASSHTLEKSPRLRAFFLYVARCALDGKPEAATEQQIGINVYDRPVGYNPNEDNIVRSQARLLRMKLEHHFATEGKDEPVIITIPKGRYLPLFEPRPEDPVAPAPVSIEDDGRVRRLRQILLAGAVLLVVVLLWLGYLLFASKTSSQPSSVGSTDSASQSGTGQVDPSSSTQPAVLPQNEGEIRIAAGRTGAPYLDVLGRRWDVDRYYTGGSSRPGPRRFFPHVADEGLFGTMREADSAQTSPQSQREFRYDVPLAPGVYEMRLYFADPLRQSEAHNWHGSQNFRHFQVVMNGQPLLAGFDPIMDAGSAAVDVRVFKDVRPAADGKLHLEFLPGWQPPFVSALELTPGTPGRLKPIRISTRKASFVDADGTSWSGDDYFIDGRRTTYASPEAGPSIPPLYSGERYGNFSYAIPVPPGSYTVKLHFMESFFSPTTPASVCHGVGCRVFDVTCNGVVLLENFDVVQAAGGAFRPVVRQFHGLHPNGQGKLLISFSPRVNYAEVRAIEVIDEAKGK